MTELLKCPFCGGEAEMDYMQPFRHYRTGELLDQPAVYCRDCSAQIAHYPGDLSLSRDETAEIVVTAWNTRAEGTALQQRVRELEEALEAICAPLQSWETHSRHSVWAQDTARKALGDTHD